MAPVHSLVYLVEWGIGLANSGLRVGKLVIVCCLIHRSLSIQIVDWKVNLNDFDLVSWKANGLFFSFFSIAPVDPDTREQLQHPTCASNPLRMLRIWGPRETTPFVSLVGGFNPSEKYESQLGWWHSQYMESHVPSHVPNHQPDPYCIHLLHLKMFSIKCCHRPHTVGDVSVSQLQLEIGGPPMGNQCHFWSKGKHCGRNSLMQIDANWCKLFECCDQAELAVDMLQTCSNTRRQWNDHRLKWISWI